MARYDHLPIYKLAMDTAVNIETRVRQFPRYHKYGIGADLRALCRRIIRLIIRANSTADKIPVLIELVETCEQFKAMLVLAKETKAFDSFQGFQQAAGQAVTLCRQSEGWRKSMEKGRNHQPRSGAGR